MDSANTDVTHILADLADAYRGKVADNLSVTVLIQVAPGDRRWYVIVTPGGQVALVQGDDRNPDFVLKLSEDTLRSIFNGELTALTAAGKAEASDIAPLEVEFGEGIELTPERRAALFGFLQHFFNRTVPEVVPLAVEHSRLVHGGHAIPLYYHPGLRSAWYHIEKGERINEPGDTNPFPQAFILISGEGFATIGKDTIRVKAGESYYIPPGSDHVVWTESDQPLELIFLAWGDGA